MLTPQNQKRGSVLRKMVGSRVLSVPRATKDRAGLCYTYAMHVLSVSTYVSALE